MKSIPIQNDRCFYYVNAQNSHDLFNLIFGYESCYRDKLPTGPNQKNCFLIHYVLSGQGILYMNDKTYSLGENDIFFIPPYTTFNYIPDQENPWEYIWLEFNGSKAKSLCDEAMLTLDNPIYTCSSSKIKDSLIGILSPPSNPLAIELHALSYLTMFLSQLIEERVVFVNSVSKKRVTVFAVQNYIDSNYANSNLGLRLISSSLYINASYLSRIYKEITGITISKYITTIRMQKARGMLATREYSINDISYMVGYTDPHYFTTEFKKFYGLSPTKLNEYTNI